MKTGESQPQEFPSAEPSIAEPMPEIGGEIPAENAQGSPIEDMGNAPQQGGESQFDTNFDAGVEADEDTDPEKFIQQLTGKLSTTLNKFNSENVDNDGLNKYVAKMIVKAATKNMDDATKKDVIKAINTSQNPEPDNDDEKKTEPTEQEPVQEPQETETPIQEQKLTKKELKELAKRRKK